LTTKDLNYTYLGTGNYPVKLVVKNRCYSDSITKTYTIRPRPDVYIGRDTVLCKNQQTIYSINPSPYDSIRWINGSNANSIIANGSINTIKIKVYLDGCKAEDTVNVIAQRFNLNFSNDFICFNRPVLFNNNSTINYGTITNYNWNFGDNETSIIKSPTHTYTVFGPKTVQLIAKSSNTCFDTLEKIVRMDDTILFNVNPVPSDICVGRSEKYTNLSVGGFNTNYTWMLNNLNPQTTTIAQYSFNIIGEQILKLTANHRCGTDSIKYLFKVKGLPKIKLDDSLITCPDQLISIIAAGDFDSVFWNNGSTSNPTETDGNTSPLVFTGYKFGCFSKDSIKIIQNCDIFIPSAFSPNNDGINDTYNFMPQNIITFNLKIFNRWGELIFETTDLNKSWDGYYKGEKCETDNYIYYATGIKKDKKQFTIKGIVTVLK
jgi:gliding motility-associated-like protein